MPITALLELTLDAAKLDAAPAIIAETLTATRAFAGCLSVEVLEDVRDSTHLVVVERWESMDADRAYRAWRAGEGKSRLGEIVAEPPKLSRFETHSTF